MYLPRLLPQWLRPSQHPTKPSGRRLARSVRPWLETLEDRTLLSTWAPKGPAPLLSGARPQSGRIAAVAASPTDANNIYIAAAGGGVWQTTDGGSNWTALTDNQTTLSMGAIALAPSNPDVIYAGTGEANNSGDSNYGRGILVSTDGGASWTMTGTSAFNKLTIAQIAVNPIDANIAYAAVSNVGLNAAYMSGTGIFKTTNGGATWTNLTASISTTDAYSDVKIDPSNPNTLYMAIGTWYGTAANGVYKTTNAGANWTKLGGGLPTSGLGRIAIADAPSNPQVIYAAIANSSSLALLKMMRSDNGGITWTDLTSGTPNYMYLQGDYDTTLIVDPANSAIVYAGGAAGPAFGEPPAMIRSTNSGVSWSDLDLLSGAVSPHPDHHGIAFDANGKLLDGDDGGLYRLDNPSPVQWSDLNGNLNTIQFQGIGLHPTNATLAVGGSQDNGTEIYNGSTWTETEGGDGGFIKYSPTNPNRVYHNAPAANVGTAFFRRSDNGGSTWVTKTASISVDASHQNFYAPLVVDPGDGNRVLYGTDRIWETTTGADSWSAISPVLVGASTYVDAIGLAASDTSTVYASFGGYFATSSRIFVTTNHGTNWVEHSLPAGSGRVADLQVDPVNAQVAYAVVSNFTSGGKHVFRTTNGGINWTDISGNLPNLPTWTLQLGKPTSGDVLYIGNDDGVYSSTNLGVSWSPLGDGLPHVQIFQLDLNPTLGILGAGTHGRGLWTLPLRTTLTVNGTGGDDTITVQNLATDPTSVEVIVNGVSVYSGAWSGLDGIVIASSTGNDTINIENDTAGVPITVNLGDGTDVVNLSPVALNLGNLMATVTVNGGSGVDTLNVDDQGTATDQSWTVAANSVTRDGAGSVNYANISNLIVNGGDGNNTYTITDTQASVGTTLNIGAGTNTAGVQGASSPLTINCASGSGGNTLVGPNAVSAWNITGSDAGALAFGAGTVTFTGVQNLTGGGGDNTFVIGSGGSVAGAITGGGGTNTLDYSAYTASVIVNLQTGQATGTGGVANIVNVNGANSSGAGLYNLLIGNGGNVLTGGASRRNILVAGGSASTLLGGAQDDLLLGGTTSYDTEAALVSWQSIAAYWAGDDDYNTRVNNLETGIGVPLLDSTTVTGNGGGNTMTGAGALALIYTDSGDTISGFDPLSQTYPITP